MEIGPDTAVQVLLPVYNEAASIEGTLRELASVLSVQARVEFVVCEDGSTDGTRTILERLAGELPIKLVLGEARKGYARAIIDGLRGSTAPVVVCLDSDGQCDPRDFSALRGAAADVDAVIGWRVRRQDTVARRAMSRLFKAAYRLLLHVPFRDPSCPFVLVSRPALDYLLAIPTLGILSQALWWEFVARLHRGGFRIAEVPVNHRPRAAGETRVYTMTRLPGIVLRHVWGLVRIRRERPLARESVPRR